MDKNKLKWRKTIIKEELRGTGFDKMVFVIVNNGAFGYFLYLAEETSSNRILIICSNSQDSLKSLAQCISNEIFVHSIGLEKTTPKRK